jgi:ABC-type sugar transport system ATPase subunit
MPDPSAPVLRMHGISKSFFSVPVLVDVDLECRPGEVHALLGENGAGKSTLMKILAGVYQPDDGEIEVEGSQLHFSHPRDAQLKGVSIIFQEFNLLPDRTVAQNVFLGREPTRHGVVDTRAMEDAIVDLMAEIDPAISIPPSAMVSELSLAQQQTVEIAKALSYEAKILVMDEPTAALPTHEVTALFERVRALRDKGMAILYISHRLKEIFELADRVTVLKDGHVVDTSDVKDVTTDSLVRSMVGRDLSHYFPPLASEDEVGDVRLSVRSGVVEGKLDGIDLELRAGEIVAVAGLAGCGNTELAEAIFGVHPLDQGTIELEGQPVRIKSPRQAIRLGMGFVAEDRKTDGLVLPLSVRDNALLPIRGLGSWLFRLPANVIDSVRDLAAMVDLRASSLDMGVRYLSGGNQQKVVLAKWLAVRSKILIVSEPTRGIDVGAKAGIHELLREQARAGVAVLMISSELPEVIGMGDRIIVMRNGAIAGELPSGATEDEIMLIATGGREGAVAA